MQANRVGRAANHRRQMDDASLVVDGAKGFRNFLLIIPGKSMVSDPANGGTSAANNLMEKTQHGQASTLTTALPRRAKWVACHAQPGKGHSQIVGCPCRHGSAKRMTCNKLNRSRPVYPVAITLTSRPRPCTRTVDATCVPCRPAAHAANASIIYWVA